jgi:hypothetical protein
MRRTRAVRLMSALHFSHFGGGFFSGLGPGPPPLTASKQGNALRKHWFHLWTKYRQVPITQLPHYIERYQVVNGTAQ